MSLIPYLLVAGYGFKLAATGETYEHDPKLRKKDLVVAGIATAYSILMLIAGGSKYLLLSALIFAPGTILYFLARREQRVAVFTAREWGVFCVLALAALVAVFAIATGRISI
ncbi:MAG: hypothetical protein EOP84_22490 [Verrucomicrobiaceae bacterium]|nr:MAG: hypothetical protein EOP84_22490 [Verrucomicrobiaceae bacterium]